MRSPDSVKHRPIRDLLRGLIKAPAAFSVLWPILLIVGGYATWHRWGSAHVATQYSGIDPTMIQVTQAPDYIRTNVVKAVYRDTAMEGLSVLDRQATAKIASAFSMHPWVRKVVGVRKLPGGAIDVRLEYRAPVAMVHVFKRGETDSQNYFFTVDEEGVLLPGGEFSPAETRHFIYIEIPGVYTNNPYGAPFGDPRVEAASQLAAVLLPYRDEAHIRSIGIHEDSRQTEVLQLELTLQSGSKMFWGSPPGEELPGEPTAQMKLRALLSADQSEDGDLRMANPMRGIRR